MNPAKAVSYISQLWTAFINGQLSAKQRLLYAENGREGYVIYKDAQGEIPMYFEFGGGDCVGIIHAPAVAEWTKKFKRLPSERDAILSFTALRAIKDKAPNCNYRISGNCIEIYEP